MLQGTIGFLIKVITLKKHSLHGKPFERHKLQMQILIFPSKSFSLKQEPLVLAMVRMLCRQTHEQAYVTAGKRLCLQASLQTSTWQERCHGKSTSIYEPSA